MDPLIKQKLMDDLLGKIKGARSNTIELDKLDGQIRQEYLRAQNDHDKAEDQNADRNQLRRYQDEVNLYKECCRLVIDASEELDEKKFPLPKPGGEASVAVELGSVQVEKKANDVKPKEKRDMQTKLVPSKLKFIQHPKSQNVTECNPLTLQCICEASNDDHTELEWLQNNRILPRNRDFLHEHSANNFNLIISAVFPEDSGVYSALFKSESTSDEQLLSSCSVIVQHRNEQVLDPGFVEFPQSLTFQAGEKARFHCELYGTTPMTVQWRFDGKPLDHASNRYVFTHHEREFLLEIPIVSPTDHGQYIVVISNDKGQATAAFSLHIDQS